MSQWNRPTEINLLFCLPLPSSFCHTFRNGSELEERANTDEKVACLIFYCVDIEFHTTSSIHTMVATSTVARLRKKHNKYVKSTLSFSR